MKHLRVLLVSGDALVRLGLRTLLTAKTTIMVGEAAGALDAIVKASALQPEIVVLDLGSTRNGGLELLREIGQAALKTRIVLLSDREDEAFVEQALMYGASAYLLRQTVATDLGWAMKAVERGQEYFSPMLIQTLRAPGAALHEPDQHRRLAETSISPIEARLISMINQSLLIRQVARQLCSNIGWMRQHHPELLAGFKPRHLRRYLGWNIIRRLFVATKAPSCSASGAT